MSKERRDVQGIGLITNGVSYISHVVRNNLVILLMFCSTYLIWSDFLGHLTNVIDLGFQMGGPYAYGTPKYEIYWSIYWGVVACLVSISLLILLRRKQNEK